jgi:hypothetical protein
MQTELARIALFGPALFAGCLGVAADDPAADADADIDADSDADADADSDSDTGAPARPYADPAAPFALLELFTSEG